MKNKTIFILIIFLFFGSLFLSAGGAKELVLDDSWKVTRIETENVIRKNLENWIEVYFDEDSNIVRISTGPAWPRVLEDMDKVFTFKLEPDSEKLYFLEDGEIAQQVTVEFSDNLKEMFWTEWKVGGLTIVGGDSPIQRITFTRK